jgi:hypothetical protein
LSGEKRRPPPQKKSSFTLDLPLSSMDSISNSTLHRRQNLTVYLTSKDADFVDHGLKFIQNSNQTKTCEKHFSSMQESVYVFNHSIISVLLSQLSREVGFNPITLLCLSQARTWIFSAICHGLLFCVQCSMLWDERRLLVLLILVKHCLKPYFHNWGVQILQNFV